MTILISWDGVCQCHTYIYIYITRPPFSTPETHKLLFQPPTASLGTAALFSSEEKSCCAHCLGPNITSRAQFPLLNLITVENHSHSNLPSPLRGYTFHPPPTRPPPTTTTRSACTYIRTYVHAHTHQNVVLCYHLSQFPRSFLTSSPGLTIMKTRTHKY